jgi:2-oxoglutarate dehydrogenase complex dehydrogenase (E1) component-like enzyme
MYISWKKDPSSVHKSWDIYFKNVENGNMKNAFCLPPSLDNVNGNPFLKKFLRFLILIKIYLSKR